MATDLDTANLSSSNRPRKNRPRRLVWIAAAVAIAALVLGIGVALDDGGDPGAEDAAPPLVLSLGADDALASCLAPSADVLRTMSPAFAGTVTATEGETITLAVDTWYSGGDAETVELHAPAGLEALIGGIDFRSGEEYFITAAGGTVNYCGFSGPLDDPGLASMVEEAFGN